MKIPDEYAAGMYQGGVSVNKDTAIEKSEEKAVKS